ncbi:MAG: class F sortase [Peptococcaceae bacterium]|nr:class F sortase [Peptococcaceae bacterium]
MKKRITWLLIVSLVLICAVTLGCQTKVEPTVEVTADVPVDNETEYSGDIAEFSYSASDSADGRKYKIALAGEEIILTAQMPKDTTLSIEKKLNPDDLNSLQDIILEKEIYKWDGFGQNDASEDQSDGQGFTLNVVYSDGNKISAQGRENYPDNYDQGNTALSDYFLKLAGPVLKFDGVFDGAAQTPTKIVISKIGVNEGIIPVGLDATGAIATTKGAFGITWYTAYSSPGWGTNAILTGHHIYNGQSGSFVRLKDLVAGDIMYIYYADGSIGRFIMKTSTLYEANSVPEYAVANTGTQRTTIITCGGNRFPQGGYSHRLVVTFEAAGRHRG